MKRLITYIFAIVLLASCTKSTNHQRHIPSNAAMVAVLDVQKMTVKAFDMSMLLEQNVFDSKGGDSKSTTVPIEQSGIDFLNKSYIVGHVADNEADNYMGLIMPLSDPYKFRQFALSHATKKPGESSSKVSYVFVGEGAILGWDQETAIYLINQRMKEEFILTSELFRLFDLPEENQMSLKNESFQKAQEKESDISIWLDINKINKYRNPVGMIVPGQKVSQGIYNAWIDFNEGSMDIKTKYYASPKTDSDKKDGGLLLKESVNKKLLSGVDQNRMVGSFNLGLNMPIIKEQLRKDGVLDSSQTYLDLVNTNTRELVDMLTGDVASCLMESNSDTDFFLAFGVKKPETSEKIIQSLSDFGLIKNFDGYYTLFNQYIILSEKDRIVISSDFDVIKGINEGNRDIPDNEIMNELNSNPLVFFLDFDRLPKKSYLRMKSYWKNFPMDTDELESIHFHQSSISNGISEGEAYVSFKNKEKNCLIIIAKALKNYSESNVNS